jgi:putative methyltransferase (TIGR04325 family)
MTSMGSLAKDWLPPAVVRTLRSWSRRGLRFEGDFSTWEQAAAQCTGYDSAGILERVLEATLKVKRGEAAFERDSVAFDRHEYAWPVTAGLMWAAARGGGRLHVLDFGGALGSSYFQNRRLLDTLPDVRWSVVEQAHYVAAGRAHVADGRLLFHDKIADAVEGADPNVVLLSSVIQYLKAPFDVIDTLAGTSATSMVIDRTPFSNSARDALVIQRVPPEIYAASYPMWILSEVAFLRRMSERWSLVAQHQSPEGLVKAGPLQASFQGMLFSRGGR